MPYTGSPPQPGDYLQRREQAAHARVQQLRNEMIVKLTRQRRARRRLEEAAVLTLGCSAAVGAVALLML